MKFINTEPRKTRHIPEWSKNLEHEESRLWLMNNHEMAHVRELIEACEYQRLQWIEKGLRFLSQIYQLRISMRCAI